MRLLIPAYLVLLALLVAVSCQLVDARRDVRGLKQRTVLVNDDLRELRDRLALAEEVISQKEWSK